MTTDTTAQTIIYDRVLPILDCQIVSIVQPGQVEPSQVGIVLTVSGMNEPLALQIHSRRALDGLVDALMRHGDEVFRAGHDSTH